ncbi:MAG: RNA methyltransferase [Bacteroidales bacterium]|nr:RNA methyltransferase [Bacteroidales bacterium]
MISKQKIKFINQLHQNKYRVREKLFIVEGEKIVREITYAYRELIKELYYTQNLNISDFYIQDDKWNDITEKEYIKISSQKNPQGILAILKMPDKKLSIEEISNTNISLVLDQIRDPGNLGTIIRLADWFGIRNIICSDDSVDCYNPKVVQASMGAIFRTSVFYTSLQEFFINYKKSGNKIFGTTLRGKDLYKSNLKGPLLIVFGNEANGISKNLIPYLDEQITIPCNSNSSERSESLNIAMAASIICSEFRRQQR